LEENGRMSREFPIWISSGGQKNPKAKLEGKKIFPEGSPKMFARKKQTLASFNRWCNVWGGNRQKTGVHKKGTRQGKHTGGGKNDISTSPATERESRGEGAGAGEPMTGERMSESAGRVKIRASGCPLLRSENREREEG